MFVDLKLSLCLASNFDLSSTLLAQTKRLKKFSSTFFKRWRGYGASSPVFAISFLPSFFLCGYTAKEKSVINTNYLLIPRLFSRFSLEKEAQRKANKRKGRFCAHAARATAFEKAVQNNQWVSANIVRAKSQFIKQIIVIFYNF